MQRFFIKSLSAPCRMTASCRPARGATGGEKEREEERVREGERWGERESERLC